jgi:hypothetical protein
MPLHRGRLHSGPLQHIDVALLGSVDADACIPAPGDSWSVGVGVVDGEVCVRVWGISQRGALDVIFLLRRTRWPS